MKIEIVNIETNGRWQDISFNEAIWHHNEPTSDFGTQVTRILTNELGVKTEFNYMRKDINTVGVDSKGKLDRSKLQAAMNRHANTPVKIRFEPVTVTGSGLSGPKVVLKTMDEIKQFRRERPRDTIVVWRKLGLNLPVVRRDIMRTSKNSLKLRIEDMHLTLNSYDKDPRNPSIGFYLLYDRNFNYSGDPWALMKRLEADIKKWIA